MLRRFRVVFISGLALVLVASAAPRTFPTDAEVLALIKERVESKRSAGIVVGLLDLSGKPRVIAYGDPGPGKPILDADSVFEIGSISKVFTGTLLAILVNEGKVKLEDPVAKYLPESVKVPSRDGKVITLGNLSEQKSGLPRMPNNFHPKDPMNPYADYTAEQMFEFLSGYQLTRDPGEQFEYSNLGVGLLGQALSRSQHVSYEELARERIWKPLGMTHTAIALTPWMQSHLALGHNAQGAVTANWDIPAFAGAGAIRSTMADMLKFLDANLHLERGPLRQAMAFAQKARAPTNPPNGSIGLNWLHRKVGEDTVVWHNGGTGGYRTFIGFDPVHKMGAVVLTNSGGVGADDIGFHLVNPEIPLARITPPPDFSGRWTTDPSPPVAGRGDMGSGWGPTITITQDTNRLTVEYVFFGRGDMQPPLKFIYTLDGSETKNSVMMGRGLQVQTSKTAWDGDKLVITTIHTFTDPGTSKPVTEEVKQVLSLESPASLIVETTRAGALGGPPIVTKTTYKKAVASG